MSDDTMSYGRPLESEWREVSARLQLERHSADLGRLLRLMFFMGARVTLNTVARGGVSLVLARCELRDFDRDRMEVGGGGDTSVAPDPAGAGAAGGEARELGTTEAAAVSRSDAA